MATINAPKTIVDGARTRFIGQLVFPILLQAVKDIVTVNDNQLGEQMCFFAERMKIIVEPTGCLGAAAVYNNTLDIGRRYPKWWQCRSEGSISNLTLEKTPIS